MKEYMAFDSHKSCALVEREDPTTGLIQQCRIEHASAAVIDFSNGTVLQRPPTPDPKQRPVRIFTRVDPAVADTQLVPAGEPGLYFAPLGRPIKPGPPQSLPFSVNPPAFAGDQLYVTGLCNLICIGKK